jgi:hypothetical protein
MSASPVGRASGGACDERAMTHQAMSNQLPQRLCWFHKRKSVIIPDCAHAIFCTALWIWILSQSGIHGVERPWRGPSLATGRFWFAPSTGPAEGAG